LLHSGKGFAAQRKRRTRQKAKKEIKKVWGKVD
jgi:hypothetical protein